MTNPFESLASLDKLIHEPARLAILTALSGVVEADFLFLEQLTGLTKGNLSTHLSKLEDAGMVKINKKFAGKKPVTKIQLSKEGQVAIEAYWKHLQELKEKSSTWQNQEASE